MASQDNHTLTLGLIKAVEADRLAQLSATKLRQGILACAQEMHRSSYDESFCDQAGKNLIAAAGQWVRLGRPIHELSTREVLSAHDLLESSRELREHAKALRALPGFSFEALALGRLPAGLESEMGPGFAPGLTGIARATALYTVASITSGLDGSALVPMGALEDAAPYLREAPERVAAALSGLKAGAKHCEASINPSDPLNYQRRVFESLTASVLGMEPEEAQSRALALAPGLIGKLERYEALSEFAVLASSALARNAREPFIALCEAMARKDPEALSLPYKLPSAKNRDYFEDRPERPQSLLIHALEQGREAEARWLITQGALHGLSRPLPSQNPFLALREPALSVDKRRAIGRTPPAELIKDISLAWCDALASSGMGKEQARLTVQAAMDECKLSGRASAQRKASFDRLVIDQSLALGAWADPKARAPATKISATRI